jgi:hypothetical protein
MRDSLIEWDAAQGRMNVGGLVDTPELPQEYLTSFDARDTIEQPEWVD